MSLTGSAAATQATSSSPAGDVNTTLYVGNLFFEVSEDALERLFVEHGAIKKTKIIYDHRGLSKG
jgi:nucleolin